MSELIHCSLNVFQQNLENPYFSEFDLPLARDIHKFHQTIPDYEKTPLVDLKTSAQKIGVEKIWTKDESKRFGLNAYKFLGVSYSIAKALLAPNEEFTWTNLQQHVKGMKEKPVFVSATDGNHGYGLAYAAKLLECDCIIYMPVDTVEQRVSRIEKLGAVVRVLTVNYDDTVIEAQEEAERIAKKNRPVQFIQDTTFENYEEIPKHIMQGYMTILSEAWEIGQFDNPNNCPTHVFLQVGVGSFSGGLSGYLVNQMKVKNSKIKIITVEPREADCVYRSHQKGNGDLHVIEGICNTVMAGLNCGTPSTIGWPMLRDSAFAFLSCQDEVTFTGMKSYHKGETSIISGESGAVTLGALIHICQDENLNSVKKQLELNETSRILLVSTEGDTDPIGYQKVIAQLHK